MTTSRRSQPAVGLEHDAAARSLSTGLVGFSQPELPRLSGVLDACRGEVNAVVAEMKSGRRGLGRRPRPTPSRRRERSPGLGLALVVDQLLGLRSSRCRGAAGLIRAPGVYGGFGRVLVDLVSRRFPPHPTALGHLIHSCRRWPNSRSSRRSAPGHLLDRRSLGVDAAVGEGESGGSSPLPRIALPREKIHRLGRQYAGRSSRSSSRGTGADDFLGGSTSSGDRAPSGLLQPHQSRASASPGVAVDKLGEPLVGLAAVRSHGRLDTGERLRVPDVPLAVGPPVELPGWSAPTRAPLALVADRMATEASSARILNPRIRLGVPAKHRWTPPRGCRPPRKSAP